MAAPTTDVALCNLALDRIGQASISSVSTPTTTVEDIVARHYDSTRREVLRKYVFNFSKKYAVLTASATVTPAFGFGTAYALPNDFVRLLALGDVTINGDVAAANYDISDGYIYTDSGDSSGLNIQYIYDAVTVSKFDPLFVRVFVLQLAANLAYKFTLKPSLLQGILSELVDVAAAAAAVAGQEKPPRRIERSQWVSARRGRSGGIDRRYIPD